MKSPFISRRKLHKVLTYRKADAIQLRSRFTNDGSSTLVVEYWNGQATAYNNILTMLERL